MVGGIGIRGAGCGIRCAFRIPHSGSRLLAADAELIACPHDRVVPDSTTSTTFSLCTALPGFVLQRRDDTFLVFVSMISPVEGSAYRPSRLNVIHPG